jgi:hypothetical protein
MAEDYRHAGHHTVGINRRGNDESKHRLRTLAFTMDGREYQAIEQNAEKPSRWGQLAERGSGSVLNQAGKSKTRM